MFYFLSFALSTFKIIPKNRKIHKKNNLQGIVSQFTTVWTYRLRARSILRKALHNFTISKALYLQLDRLKMHSLKRSAIKFHGSEKILTL